MHHGNRYALEHPERDKPLLQVVRPIVFKRERRPRKHLGRVNEVQSVRFQIGTALLFIPLVVHLQSVYTSKVPRKRQNMPANARVERPDASASRARTATRPAQTRS
jgi:hypothetical protein